MSEIKGLENCFLPSISPWLVGEYRLCCSHMVFLLYVSVTISSRNGTCHTGFGLAYFFKEYLKLQPHPEVITAETPL